MKASFGRSKYDALSVWRSSRKQPGLLVAGIVSLSIGLAACTLVLSAIRAGTVASLPYADPSHLVQLVSYSNRACAPRCVDLISGPFLRALRERAHSFRDIGTSRSTVTDVITVDTTRSVLVAGVDSGFFRTLVVRAAFGRTPSAHDFDDGAPPVAVISDRFWLEHYGRRLTAIGQTVRVRALVATIVGVMPPTFDFPERSALWIAETPLFQAVDSLPIFSVVARLKEGVSALISGDEVAGIFTSEFTTVSGSADHSLAGALPMNWIALGYARESSITLGVILATLLIASANLAGVAAARIISSRTTFAIRIALGAGTGDIRRLILSEGALVGFLAGLTGLGIAFLLRPVVTEAIVRTYSHVVVLSIPPVLFVAVLVFGTGIGLLVGAIAAFAASDMVTVSALREGASTPTKRSLRFRQLLVASEIAIALTLASGAGTMGTVLLRIQHLDLGFDADHTLLGRAQFTSDLATGRIASDMAEHLVVTLQHSFGVRAASAYVQNYPRSATGNGPRLSIEGDTRTIPLADVPPYEYDVTPSFFQSLGVPVTMGRPFNETDALGAEPTAIINAAAASRWFGDRPVLGRHIRLRSSTHDPIELRIVGVVSNTHVIGDAAAFGALSNPGFFPLVFRPLAQSVGDGATPVHGLRFVVRTHSAPGSIAESIRHLVATQPGMSLEELETVRLATSSFGPLMAADLRARLLAALAVIGVFISALGVFGIVSDTVARRRREIGIRLAFGATPRTIVLLLVRDAIVVALAGVVVGTFGATFVSRLLASLMPDVGPLNIAMLCLISGVAILGATLLSAAFGARTASAISPLAVMASQ